MTSPERAGPDQPHADETPTNQLPPQDPPEGGSRFVPLTDRVTSTANTPTPGAVGRHAAPEPTGERGTLSIEDVVVEKVAVAAAGEVDGVGGAARRVLGLPTGADGDGRPRVSARVTGGTVALQVRLTVAYPTSVRATGQAVRAHLRDRVEALTELTVTRVDVDVAALTTTKASTRRVLA